MPLDQFLPATHTWFSQTLGQPTPPQAQGWPAIQAGDHTLILAPTGSGKTLTAFLWGIDQLFRELTAHASDQLTNPPPDQATKRRRKPKPTTRLLYISPLKALNNDIERNLRTPLAGIRQVARQMGKELPEVEVAVRSGDTPQRERQAMLRRPPHILITTPESLYLMLTSPKARELFQTVRTVIVDEIHTLVGSKRGVHLSLSLERLQKLAAQPIQRIGLSATIQPLAEAARFLGGNEWEDGLRQAQPAEGALPTADADRQLSLSKPRPVTIVNAAYQKALDLQVETVVDDFRNLPDDSIWPVLIPRVVEQIQQHNTTLVFVNDRRAAERAADRINAQMYGQENEN
ncbi:MAG: DEAD/DEAH box helicase, partial [Caldilineaceae bacterium]|nr:DEAD/DEAH box helicase [Caldilineaceae bacterium]